MSDSAVTLDFNKAKPIGESEGSPWVGVDLDGSLARYTVWRGKKHIGAPIPMMVDRVKRMLANGDDVRIFTARVSNDPDGEAKKAIEDWTEKHIGKRLPVTHIKDEHLRAMYDDRAIQLERNTGEVLGSQRKAKSETDSRDKKQATKFQYGNTQATIPKGSDAHGAIVDLQGKIADSDLMAKGKDVDEPHVTVRYGIQGEDTSGIRSYIEKQAPFDAKLGKTEIFPPTKNSDGAAVVIAPVVSPELHRMNAEIEKAGDFKESDFPEYKPHATVAYVNPDAAEKYKGITDAEGKTFRIVSVDISDRDGKKEAVQLKGKKAPSFYKPKGK